MGHGYSKEQITSNTIKYIIRDNGSRITHQQLQEFIGFLNTNSPWFLEKGTLCLENWLLVKGDIQDK